MASPDSRRLLYQIRNVNSYVIDADRPGTEQKPQALPGQPPLGFIGWDWSPDGAYLIGWQHGLGWGIVVYSFASQRYEHLNDKGAFPVWLNDSQRLIFREYGDLFYWIDAADLRRKSIRSKGPGKSALTSSRATTGGSILLTSVMRPTSGC